MIMNTLIATIRRFHNSEAGATMVEYSLMVALIAIVCLAAVALLGTNVNAIYNQMAAGA